MVWPTRSGPAGKEFSSFDMGAAADRLPGLRVVTGFEFLRRHFALAFLI